MNKNKQKNKQTPSTLFGFVYQCSRHEYSNSDTSFF